MDAYIKRFCLVGVFIWIVLIPATVTAKTVQLSWDASPTPAVVGYVINVLSTPSTSSIVQEVDVGNVLTQTLKNLEDTSEHWFCVKAYDEQRRESVCSNIVHSPAIVDDLPELDLHFDVEIIK